MLKKTIYTKNAPEPIGPYSQAILFNPNGTNLIYTSGQIPIDPANENIVAGGIKEQTARVIQNIEAILKEEGTDLSKVIKTTVFLKDMNQFAEMNTVYDSYFGTSKPARSTVEVARLPKDVLVEIEVIAFS